ncbi:ABC transporter substrate-binding protein, partial [Pseudolysinimonas sp.]
MTRKARSRAALAATGVALTGALVLAGCSGGGDGGSGGPAFDPDEEITLEMSWWGDDNRAALFDEVITAFEAEYPNVTVTQTPVGSPDDLFNRLATDFGGGGDTAPDVFALGGAKPQEYGSVGALYDMTELEEYLNVADYPESSLTSSTVDGVVYGLPTGGNATAAFVNVDILEQAGVEVPENGWTWDDLIEIASAVGDAGLTNAAGQRVYGVDMRSADIVGTFAAQETEYGLYTPEGELGVEADTIAKFYEIEQRLLEAGGLPDPSIITASTALPPDQQLYTLGQAAITFGYSNLIGTYSGAGETVVLTPPSDTDKTGVALLPS